MELIIQLFQFSYNHEDSDYVRSCKNTRKDEYNRCLLHNLANKYENKIHIFVQNVNDENYFKQIVGSYIDKCKFILFEKGQPHYKDFIEYAYTLPDNTVISIMNADIMFEHDLDFSLIDKYVHTNQMFGLSRHEYTTENHTICRKDTCRFIWINVGGSADTFIMRTPIMDTVQLDRIDHKQNLGGAEGAFLKCLNLAGYYIWNASIQIRTIHLHTMRGPLEYYTDINTKDNSFMSCPIVLPDVHNSGIAGLEWRT